MAIDLKKEKYNINNSQQRTDGYYGPDGEFYPNGSIPQSEPVNEVKRYPVGSAPIPEKYPEVQPAKEIYPNNIPVMVREQTPAREVRRVDYAQPAYPDIQTVGNDLPYDMSGINNGNIQGNTQITPAKRKKPVLPLVIGICAVALIGISGSVVGFLQGFFGDMDHQFFEFTPVGINQIIVNDSGTQISIYGTDGENIEISTSEKGQNYQVNTANGVLSVDYKSDKGFGKIRESIDIYIPEQYMGDISIANKNGKINIYELKAGNITANTTNDNIYVQDTIFTGITELHTTNDNIDLSRVQFGASANISTTNDDISAENVDFGEFAVLTTSNDGISFSDVSFKNIELKTTNSDIEVEMYGDLDDYTYSSSTSNGSNNLGNGGSGEYKLVCNTTNGDIEFEFDGNDPDDPEIDHISHDNREHGSDMGSEIKSELEAAGEEMSSEFKAAGEEISSELEAAGEEIASALDEAAAEIEAELEAEFGN